MVKAEVFQSNFRAKAPNLSFSEEKKAAFFKIIPGNSEYLSPVNDQ